MRPFSIKGVDMKRDQEKKKNLKQMFWHLCGVKTSTYGSLYMLCEESIKTLALRDRPIRPRRNLHTLFAQLKRTIQMLADSIQCAPPLEHECFVAMFL